MATIPNSDYATGGGKIYADGTIWDENDLDTLANYLQNYINARKNDLQKLANDSQGTDYVLNGVATPLYTNTLFQKQNDSLYNTPGADISIGLVADAGYSSVSGTYGVISFTPERTGDYKLVFDFVHHFSLTATSEGQCITAFRVSDGGVINSIIVTSGGYFPAPVANAITMYNPIHIEVILNGLEAAVPYNFYLQKRNISMTNVASNNVSGLVTTGQINISIEKI